MAKSKKSTITWVVVVVVIAIIAWIVVKNVFFPSTFYFAGTLEGTKVDLSSRLQTNIQDVLVQEGDHVKKDQVVVKLTCEDYISDAKIANINYERNLEMFKHGTVNKETLDNLQSKKEAADIKVDWCTIKSPIDGTVLSRYHEPGESVSPGTKLLTLENIKDIWAYIYVPQPEVASLKPGQKLRAILPEQKNREFTGTIEKINDEAEFTPKNVQTREERQRLIFGVKVSFRGANEDETLKPGMTVEVELPK